MSGPYVQLVVEHLLKRTAHVATVPKPAYTTRSPDEWIVVHDARGRVVVRAFTAPGGMTVIGTGTWRDNAIVDRVGISDQLPSADQWSMLETLLYPPLRRGPHESGATDDGVVLRPGDPAPAPAAASGIKNPVLGALAYLALFIALAIAGVGYWYWQKLTAGTVANGDKCSSHSDCKSGRCERDGTNHKTCEPAGVRGDRCVRGRDCSSGTCNLRLCE